ncbi:ABC-type multidrug transport system ATPase subunit [Thermosporothrix hazakensis]|jgi:ABC-type multidrug transport system ATPase subunit/pSer/pThr/pTyr-binding forkhead associated (FHA) protein/ABC-type multidrug transport system permease subunit|uniref:ABC-type multidrug transport system ATPase subunit n=2 Tax=Thermosporothrix TaxID=768650 RepID=A0A326U0Z5_THEHA|nr:FHA domain-containing protein [Thermosporothrix hazakensis]PZW24204.1 ABC-type multidrug transport system ATPase subunit [Thermosporothrix hazakensis]BBH89650.1 ABC transporter ATP-binding protein [Thermosporothrix sp. COM3]GCE47836.1 ABC transporter ATP-binding protein [Thermosporothrix hazakensis]
MNGQQAHGTLQILSGSQAGQQVPLVAPVMNIGRDPANQVVLPDASVSRLHAQLLLMNNGMWSIKKLAPQNVLTVNQRPVEQAPLKHNDVIVLGNVTMTFLQVPNAVAAGAPSFPPQQQYGAPDFTATRTIGAGEMPGRPSNAGGQSAGVPSIEVSTNIDSERHNYPLTPDKQVFNIGRAPSNEIVIEKPTVSAFHAQILREGNQLVFVHPHPGKGSTTNGIVYNGRQIRGTEQFRKVLERGDIFRISDGNGTFVTLAYNDGTGAVQEVVPEVRPIPLGAPVITLGRAPDNHVVLKHVQVSAHHARLEQVGGGYRIVDLRSKNGLYVNGMRTRVSDLLKPGDEVRIGPFRFIYTGEQLTQQDESNGIRIDALNLKKTGTNNVILLNDISIAIPPRKFVALVGGSGAGKSTLMDALNGLRPAHQGAVFYNGQDYYQNMAAFSTQLGYVPQDDIIHRELTVEHALYYAAKLRLPEDVSDEQIRQRIDEVLDDVEMTGRRKLLINKLSGGQRKRVSIALELLANPSVFFLDEPTSGLDPGLDRKMMMLLRRLADKGHTIVLVTHATNNINACDYVCFLAQGGRLAYFGPPDGAKAYFGKSDFAEIYTSLEPTEENPNIPAEAEMRFKQSPDYQRFVVQQLQRGPANQMNAARMQPQALKRPKRGNPFRQFGILSIRYLELLRNDVGNLLILLLQAPIIGLILFFMAQPYIFKETSLVSCPHPKNMFTQQGGITEDCGDLERQLNSPQGKFYLQEKGKTKQQVIDESVKPGSGGNGQKILFIMSFAAVMFGCINGAREIVKEAPIYRRERTVNLGIAPYMFSKIIVLGVLCLLQSLILVLCIQLKTGFYHSVFLPAFLEIYITMALTSLAGLMLGLMISALVPTNDRAMSMVPIVLIPQVIFAGVIFSLDDPKMLQIPAAFFPSRWSMAAMGTTVGLRGDSLGADDFSYVSMLYGHATQSQAFQHLLLTWGALALMIVVFAVVIAFCLKLKDVRK